MAISRVLQLPQQAASRPIEDAIASCSTDDELSHYVREKLSLRESPKTAQKTPEGVFFLFSEDLFGEIIDKLPLKDQLSLAKTSKAIAARVLPLAHKCLSFRVWMPKLIFFTSPLSPQQLDNLTPFTAPTTSETTIIKQFKALGASYATLQENIGKVFKISLVSSCTSDELHYFAGKILLRCRSSDEIYHAFAKWLHDRISHDTLRHLAHQISDTTRRSEILVMIAKETEPLLEAISIIDEIPDPVIKLEQLYITIGKYRRSIKRSDNPLLCFGNTEPLLQSALTIARALIVDPIVKTKADHLCRIANHYKDLMYKMGWTRELNEVFMKDVRKSRSALMEEAFVSVKEIPNSSDSTIYDKFSYFDEIYWSYIGLRQEVLTQHVFEQCSAFVKSLDPTRKFSLASRITSLVSFDCYLDPQVQTLLRESLTGILDDILAPIKEIPDDLLRLKALCNVSDVYEKLGDSDTSLAVFGGNPKTKANAMLACHIAFRINH